MRHLAASLKSGWPWWWGFGLLIALPALALAVLGLRAVRVERVEREQQAREQQTQIARLADAAISNALAALEATLLRDEASEARRADGVTAPEAFVFSFDQQGVLAFPRERVWFGEATRFRTAEWSPATQQLIEQAQAAEAQARQREAVTLYRRIGAAEPKLGGWAEVCVARIRQQSGEAAALLSDAAWSQSADLTPTGLPVGLMLCPYAERLSERSRFIPLLEQSLASLRSGRWWLSYDERQFYDGELRRLLASVNPNQHAVEDDRLRAMAALERIVRAALPSRRDATTRSYEGGFLLLWSPAQRAPEAWNGLALAQRQMAELIEAALTPLLAGQPFAVVLRETNGEVLWSRLAGNSPPMHTAALRSVVGWELVFSLPNQSSQRSWPEQRELLWYGFILLLVVLLLIGLAMTAGLVRREIELSRMQNEFIAAVSHEFKSPLTSIRLLMERITSGRLRTAEAAGEYYAAIVRETDRLERLVNRLLDAQQLQAGQQQYHFAPTSLTEILTNVVAQMRHRLRQRGSRWN